MLKTSVVFKRLTCVESVVFGVWPGWLLLQDFKRL